MLFFFYSLWILNKEQLYRPKNFDLFSVLRNYKIIDFIRGSVDRQTRPSI